MWPINASVCRSLSANTPLPLLTLTLNLNFHYLCTHALYLADDCRLVSDSTRRSLRSADVSTCVVPRTLSSYRNRTFAAAGPRLWNSLPIQLRNPDITYTDSSDDSWRDTFFREARTRRSMTSDMRRHRKHFLTYLLATQHAVPNRK